MKHEKASEESEDVRYDYFISHNWSVKRWKKFMALCMLWNCKRALISACIMQALCFSLVALDVLPLIRSSVNGHEISIWCIGTCVATFVLVFLFMSDVLQMVGVPGYRLFLDKVCVDQSDEDRKRQGIGAITAFLYHSDGLVVLFSEMYLTRLWTVYELTTFLALKPEGELLVQPVILGPVTAYLVILQTFQSQQLFLAPSDMEQFATMDVISITFATVSMGLNMLGLFCGAIFLRMWGRTRANMGAQIADFSFEHALCHSEEDRKTIFSAIKKIAREGGLVEPDASTRDCIASYEQIVQQILPRRMSGAFGLCGIPWQLPCLMTLPCLAQVLDRAAVQILQGTAALKFLEHLLVGVNIIAWMPLAIGFVGIVSGVRRGSWYFEVLCISTCFVFLVLGIWLPQSPMMPFPSLLDNASVHRCVVLAVVFIVQCSALLCMYGGACCKKRPDRKTEVTEE